MQRGSSPVIPLRRGDGALKKARTQPGASRKSALCFLGDTPQGPGHPFRCPEHTRPPALRLPSQLTQASLAGSVSSFCTPRTWPATLSVTLTRDGTAHLPQRKPRDKLTLTWASVFPTPEQLGLFLPGCQPQLCPPAVHTGPPVSLIPRPARWHGGTPMSSSSTCIETASTCQGW